MNGVPDDVLEDVAFEISQTASHIGWTDEEREEQYLRVRDRLLALRGEERRWSATFFGYSIEVRVINED